MNEMTNIKSVQRVYEGFGNGDLQAILAELADDVVLDDPGPEAVPHAGTYRGHDGASQFFARLTDTLEFEDFKPRDFFSGGDCVVVLGSLRARVKATGRSYDNEWAMVWTFRNGRIARFQVIEDTARELAAHA